MTKINTKSLDERVADLEVHLAELEKRLSGADSKFTLRKSLEKISINEFLKQKNIQNDVQRALVVAYWLDYFEKVDFFNTSDLEEAFRTARLTLPKNMNDKVNMNIKNGHMADLKKKKEGKKTWYVTNTGAVFVENELNR